MAESCFGTDLGARVHFGKTDQRPDVVLFNETQGRIVISVKPNQAERVSAELERSGVAFSLIGAVTLEPYLSIAVGTSEFKWSVSELNQIWEKAIPTLMED